MGSNKRDLKAYVRYDGSGRVVAGSLVLRRQKPKVGKWKEVQGYQCCNLPVITSTAIVAFPATDPSLVLYCDESHSSIAIGVTGTFATVEEFVSALNVQCGSMGTFSVANDGINININPAATLVPLLASCTVRFLYFEIF